MFHIRRTCIQLTTIYKLSTFNYSFFNKYNNVQKLPARILYNSLCSEKLRLYCTNDNSPDVLTLTEEQMKEITHDNEELIYKLKVLLLETEVMRQEGKAVPSQATMKMEHWKELLERESRSGRRKYLEFLFKIEKKKENQILKKEQKRVGRSQREPLAVDGPFRYDLGHNNMFLRFYDSTINHLYNSYLIRAMQFSQKIVIDCGYHEHMTKRENINCAKQLMLVFADNRMHKDPFDVHFCNLQKNSILEDYLHRFIPTMYDAEFPLNVYETSYLDHFPKEKIVYLTPHCREELAEFDHDAVYIIGAIVDKINNEPVSMAKAKREGLKMAKFPLDKYLMWGSGSGKSLTINQVLSIMLDLRMNGDWNHALRHVPKRKLVQYDEETAEQVAKPWRTRDSSQKVYSEKPWHVVQQESTDKQYQRKSSSWRPKNANDTSNKERLVHLKSILNE